MYELVTHEHVFAGADPEAIFKCANAFEPYPWAAAKPHPLFRKHELRSCIEGCARRDPMARLSAPQAVSKLQRLKQKTFKHAPNAIDMQVRAPPAREGPTGGQAGTE